MTKSVSILLLLICFARIPTYGEPVKDSLNLKGQLSGWMNMNPKNALPVFSGMRYIPTLDYGIRTSKGGLLDCEIAANFLGTLSLHPFDTISSSGSLKPYRFWLRYSTNQFELRLGLQKINFGSASILRPLMWFDQLDPRDPLQLTDGVWGLLARYYFLNNANIWFWSLYGNDKTRTMDIGTTRSKIPEFGGRFQMPVPRGEIALSGHYRQVDSKSLGLGSAPKNQVGESRIGLDGKWDLGIGLWAEGSWIHKFTDSFVPRNQEVMNIGADYTFGIGNGLNLTYEQLVISSDQNAFSLNNPIYFSGFSINYPVGMFDQASGIVYFDWKHTDLYSFINWKHQFNRLVLYIMGYVNPEQYNLPQQNNQSSLFVGKGLQFMLVFNH